MLYGLSREFLPPRGTFQESRLLLSFPKVCRSVKILIGNARGLESYVDSEMETKVCLANNASFLFRKKSSESRIFAQPFLNFVVFFKNSIVRIYEKKDLISLHVTF